MVKFMARGAKGITIGLGITDENIELLKQDRPISVNMTDFGPDWQGEIVILYGKDEAAIEQSLRDSGLVPPQIAVHDPEATTPMPPSTDTSAGDGAPKGHI